MQLGSSASWWRGNSLQLRIIRRNTLIISLRSQDRETISRYTWLAFHQGQRNWGSEFSKALDLLMEDPIVVVNAVTFAGDSGRIMWQRSGFWTIIRVKLGIYSIKKRRLIAAGLLKAARNAECRDQENTNG
jgi:hypothetical protein